jgi:hypothetical protein
MKTYLIYVDDAQELQQVLAQRSVDWHANTHWLLVACAPRITHRVSKWVSHSSRENWRDKWASKLFEQVRHSFEGPGHSWQGVVARGPVAELTDDILADHPHAEVIDARRPKLDPRPASDAGWSSSLAVVLGFLGVAADM